MRAFKLLLVIFIIFTACSNASGSNFGIGVHGGYGVIKFEEKETYLGEHFDSESSQNVILLGVSGEYSLRRPENLYVGITTDWAFGLKDEEIWRRDNVRIQSNDIRISGQFYDLRFGYKNSLNNLNYRFYASGGWDGLRFKRERWAGTEDTITEDISLWRAGAGADLAYGLGKWALNGRIAYSYYPGGKTEDSSLPQLEFDTEGTCLDFGLGIAREITNNMGVFLGGNYTLQKLKGDEARRTILWESRLEILVGVVNITYAF
ncbi:MAG TPA: hypothetical protein ENH40_03500 [Nitrospirae bacterium]|nr:hypothetical protein [Nitrospirota bacterium]